MHTKSKYPWLRHTDFLIVDLIALLLSFSVSFFIKFGGVWFLPGREWTVEVWARFVLLFSAADIFFTFLLTPYEGIFKRKHYYMEVIQELRLTLYNAISVALTLYIFKRSADYSRTVFLLTYMFYPVLSHLMKYGWKRLVVSGIIRNNSSRSTNLFVVTQKHSAETILRNISAEEFAYYDVTGLYLTDDTGLTEYNGIPVIPEHFSDYVIKNNIRDVLIAVEPSAVEAGDYKKLIGNAVNVHISVGAMVGVQTEEQFISDVGIYKTLSVGAFTFSPRQLMYLAVKRVLDFLCGLVVLILLIPLTVFVKCSYLLNGDSGRIFYTQNRVGRNGKPIRIWKYRTMVQNADTLLEELLQDEAYRREWEQNQKLANDPRITKVGAFLRKASIDELPQAINLLKGDMSLVGPRPLVEGELEAHNGLKLYQRVKPGITGWWACNGRSTLDYHQRLELEYYYIKHFSMYLDVLCVFRTVFAVLRRNGAA